MTDEKEAFLDRCLEGIPRGKYRARLRAELEDHLALLSEDLRRAGYTEAETGAEALRQMGDADALNADYQTEWLRRPERLGYDLKRLFGGCLLAGVTFFFGVALVLIPVVLSNLFTLPALVAGSPTPPLPPRVRFLLELAAGAVMYAAAFLPNALYLRKAFRCRTDRPLLVGGGLLLSWIVGKGSAALLLMPKNGLTGFFSQLTRQDASRLLTGAELQWFRWPLVALSLLGCVALGWLFGREKPKKTEEAKDETE